MSDPSPLTVIYEEVTLSLPSTETSYEPQSFDDQAYQELIDQLLKELDDMAEFEKNQKAKVNSNFANELNSVLTAHQSGSYLRKVSPVSVQKVRDEALEAHKIRILQQPWPSTLQTIRNKEYNLRPVLRQPTKLEVVESTINLKVTSIVPKDVTDPVIENVAIGNTALNLTSTGDVNAAIGSIAEGTPTIPVVAKSGRCNIL